MKMITKIIKTAVHGDFQLRNILIDKELQKVNVIDWDWRFQEKGNPIYDFVWLATNIMMFSNNPEKEFIPLPTNTGCACNECPHMRLNTMDKIVTSLQNMQHEIILDEELRLKALKPLNRMLEIV